jgi:hypothetical protein
MKKLFGNSMWLRIIMAAALVVIIIIALIPIMPLKVTPASASQSEFSAERAMNDLKVVSASPHPMGSAAQEKVTNYLLVQIQTTGVTA